MSARWKRNAVVAVMAVLVCSAVALNWLYTGQEVQEASGGKLLGEAQLVSGKGTEKTGEEEKTGEGEQAPAPAEEETGAPPDEGMIYTGSDYFASARLTRQQARDSALTMLQNTLTAGDTEAAMLDAGAAIETLASTTVSEAQIENLVVAKGYTDCVAFISDGGVSVVVSATENGLQDADVARITEIVTGETGVPASQITIIEAQG